MICCSRLGLRVWVTWRRSPAQLLSVRTASTRWRAWVQQAGPQVNNWVLLHKASLADAAILEPAVRGNGGRMRFNVNNISLRRCSSTVGVLRIPPVREDAVRRKRDESPDPTTVVTTCRWIEQVFPGVG